MKKRFTLFLFAVLILSIPVQAQLADGSIAPDFTATDINGVEHNLYDLLDAGKSVVLDISATWCPPCWDYHTSGILEELWTTYGPDGSDEIYVFMIEGDGATSNECLYGSAGCIDPNHGNSSLGDWTAGIEYPIIDDADIASAYEIAFFPTVYHICPDKIVTQIGQANLAEYPVAHNACAPWVIGNNNVAAGAYTGDANVPCGEAGTITPKLLIRNMGTANLTSVDVEFLQDDASVEIMTWTGDLPTLETAEITFADVTVNTVANFEFILSNPNGVDDESAANNVLATTVGVEKTSTTVVYFEMRTDFWPEETSWNLTDDSGTVLYSNADEGTLTCDEVYTQIYELELNKCYTLSIADAFGDGLLNGAINPGSHSCGTPNGQSSQAMGSISISSSQGVLFDEIAYAGGVDISFFVNETAVRTVEVLEVDALSLFPNPAKNELTVNFDLPEAAKLQVAVYNAVGQKVQTVATKEFSAGKSTLDVNTTSFANGIYFLRMHDGERELSRRFVVIH